MYKNHIKRIFPLQLMAKLIVGSSLVLITGCGKVTHSYGIHNQSSASCRGKTRRDDAMCNSLMYEQSQVLYDLIHQAAEYGYDERIKSLLKIGSNIYEQHKNCWIPLHWAAKKGHLRLCKTLVIDQNFDINTKEYGGRTPLDYAAENGQLEIVKWLLENNANIIEEDQFGYTALHRAAEQGHEAVIRCLVCTPYINHEYFLFNFLNKKNNLGKTPLDLAKKYNHLECIELLNNTQLSLECLRLFYSSYFRPEDTFL